MHKIIKLIALSLIGLLMTTTPILGQGYFSSEAMKQSFTHKNPKIKFQPGVFYVGNSRTTVFQAFGPPNGTDYKYGVIEDVYIFLKDGSKYVNPAPRARNVALAVVTMGTSVAIRQARLAHQRTQLRVFHVFYNDRGRIIRITEQKGSAVNPIPYKTNQ